MKSTASLLFLALGLAQAGCIANADDMDIDAIGDVGLETLEDPNGSGGNNGHLGYDFVLTRENLWLATFSPWNNSNTALAQLQGSSPGQSTVAYAARCALTGGRVVLNGFAYPAGGILNTTNNWPTTALTSPQQKYDLMECMMAHLNPNGESVPIRLTGEAVNNTLSSGDSYEYSFQEALWVAYQDGAGELHLEAYPFPDMETKCHAITSSALEKRGCGEAAGTNYCFLDVKTVQEQAAQCTKNQQTGFWTCNGHRAIQTWLKADGWLTLYSDCR